MKRALVLASMASVALAFVPTTQLHPTPPRTTSRSRQQQHALRMVTEELPSQAVRQQALYDMVYVERLPEAQQMTSGLFLPGQENPRMHVCKVVSMGAGREGESGTLVENAGIKPGDLVYVKDPWGIGPKDDEFGNHKFSFVRYQNICAIVPNSAEYEAAARKAGEEALAFQQY